MSKTITISWDAIVAGAIVGLGLNFLLNLLSFSIGLSLFTFTSNNTVGLSVGGFAGFIIVAILSMFTSGWVAGILSSENAVSKKWGLLYGFLTWSLCLAITTILLTNMIQFASFHGNFTSQPDLVALRIVNDQPMMTESSGNSSTAVMANIEKKNKTFTVNAFLTFFLFLIGTIASCLGGYIGLSPRKRQHS